MHVGFIGLGHMGSAMARNLLKAGHDVTVFNRSQGKVTPLVALGAHEARFIADACAAEIVITMLANDSAVSDIVFATGGLIASLPKRSIHLSMSTISPALSTRLAQAHLRAGQRYVAAPVFGRPDMASSAELFIVAAGDPDAIDLCQPLFDALGQKTSRIGMEPSAANLVKLTANFLQAAVIEALGEAIALIGKSGIDRVAYVELLTSTIFTSPAYKIFGPSIASGTYEPAGFPASLGHKDIRLALDAAETLCVPMPLASLLHDRFLRLFANGGDKLDWSAIGALATEDACGSQRALSLSAAAST
jgi:3-hydroxyisobutyrate dehydrogenase-like beta-hydroxyacid dehydrogenase